MDSRCLGWLNTAPLLLPTDNEHREQRLEKGRQDYYFIFTALDMRWERMKEPLTQLLLLLLLLGSLKDRPAAASGRLSFNRTDL